MKPASRSRRALRRLLRGKVEPVVVVVSYPKCGRTWLRAMLGKALCEQFGLHEADLFRTLDLSGAAGLLPTKFVHDGAGGAAGVPWHRQDRDKTRFRSKKVALLVRDPRDVVVSSYFQASRRMRIYEGPIEDFVRDECFGIRSIVSMYAAWETSRDVPRDFLLLRYEDMHREPASELRALLGFMGLDDPEASAVERAVRFGEFSNMRLLEGSRRFLRKMSPGDPDDFESYKVRRGKIGGFADYLSQRDVEWMDAVIREAGNPFAAAALVSPSPAPPPVETR